MHCRNVVLFGLAVGAYVAAFRPQMDQYNSPRFNVTGNHTVSQIFFFVAGQVVSLSCSLAVLQVSEKLESLLYVIASLLLVHQMACHVIRRVGSSPTLREKVLG